MNTLQTTVQKRNTHCAQRGGQASIGLFGTSGFTAPRQPLPRTPRASRIKGALNSFDSDGLSAAAYRKPAVAVPTARVERNELGEPVPVAVPTFAMRRAAEFSEARLRSECEVRFQDAVSRRRAGAGHIETTLAIEG